MPDSDPSPDPVAAMLDALDDTRAITHELEALATPDELVRQYHPDFSPAGWHLGHVAAFEAWWVLERAHGEPPLSPAFERSFDPRELPKSERSALPPRAEVRAWGDEVRRRVRAHLQREAEAPSDDPLRRALFVYGLVLAHEQQHAETIATVLRMRPRERREQSGWPVPTGGEARPAARLRFPFARAAIGCDDRRVAYDNEGAVHEVELAPYELDATPVTNEEWLAFMDAGGYARRELWSEQGWRLVGEQALVAPFHWIREGRGWRLRAFGGDVDLPLAHPVEGISAFEADAYARFAGRRLPTEAEWEHAARTHPGERPHIGLRSGGTRAVGPGPGFVGNAWEWTSSAFAAYPGFRAFPYEGYSAPYFDGSHRVMRGGSWATQARNARATFRNWYQPHWRAMFAGLRLAGDA